MAIISSFLCWSNTRIGSAVCGYYTLIISVVCLSFYILRYIAQDDNMKDSIELKGIVYAGFVLYSFLIGVSLILLPGVYMDRKLLLQPWIYVLVITVLYETGAIALITTVHLEQDHKLDVWEIVAVAFYCVRLVANCYCFACVVSQYQELSEGRGTYEYLYKPRRRQNGRARGCDHLSDIEEYNPPYGATLPPYSEENPYKEYSPPTYENLGIDYTMLDAYMGCAPSGQSSRRWEMERALGTGISGSCVALADVEVNTPPRGMGLYDDCEFQTEPERYSQNDPQNLGNSYTGIFHERDNEIERRERGDDSNRRQHWLEGYSLMDDLNQGQTESDVDCLQSQGRPTSGSHVDPSSDSETQHLPRKSSSPQFENQRNPYSEHHDRDNSHPEIHHHHTPQQQQHTNRSRHYHRHHRRNHSRDTNSSYAGGSCNSSPTPNSHQHHHHQRHHRARSADAAIAMTSSSACLLDDGPNVRRPSPAHSRPKRVPISPLTIQKRTYITWI